MKKILSLLLMLTLCASMFAQSSQYIETLTEGKTWKVLIYSYSSDDRGYVIYRVSGDTIVNERKCKRIQVVEQKSPIRPQVHYPNMAAFEEDGKIYRLKEGETPSLVIDFTLNVGDVMSEEKDFNKVTNVDYVTVDGIPRKRIVFGDNDICWVEGIGANCDFFIDTFVYSSVYRNLLECYDNDRLIFTWEDFDVSAPWYMSVDNVTTEAKKTGVKYSIEGMKLNSTPEKGIFIMDGKKMAR